MNQDQALQVLIAEDDALINDGIAKQLERLGYAPAAQAYDGAQAVEIASRTHPAVVLMDLQMIDPATGREDPEAGLKAARTIQERSPAAVVVLTAHESPELVRHAADAGVNGYLLKPAADPDLGRMITIARARFDEMLKWRGMAAELQRSKEELQATLARLGILSGLVLVCAWCHKIQDDDGAWMDLETYVKKHSTVRFSHGVCAHCFERLAPHFRSGPGA